MEAWAVRAADIRVWGFEWFGVRPDDSNCWMAARDTRVTAGTHSAEAHAPMWLVLTPPRFAPRWDTPWEIGPRRGNHPWTRETMRSQAEPSGLPSPRTPLDQPATQLAKCEHSAARGCIPEGQAGANVDLQVVLKVLELARWAGWRPP